MQIAYMLSTIRAFANCITAEIVTIAQIYAIRG
jgi:hypothetical protein